MENTHRVYDIFNETMTTKFIITKSDLLKNKENKRNLAIIEQYPDDEINIGEKIDEWFQSITLLMENILEEFTSNISEETKIYCAISLDGFKVKIRSIFEFSC